MGHSLIPPVPLVIRPAIGSLSPDSPILPTKAISGLNVIDSRLENEIFFSKRCRRILIFCEKEERSKSSGSRNVVARAKL